MDYKEITRQTYNEIADDYTERDSQVVDETFDVKESIDKFISLLPQGASVLDIGSGGGRDSRYFLQHGMKVTGIDFSEKMIHNAKEKAPEIEYIHMDFESITFPENYFDGVWANASLHHIPKSHIEMVLKSIYKILKKDAVLFIIIKHGTFDGLREMDKFGKKVVRHFSFYLPEEFIRLLESVGFTVIENYLTTNGEWLDVLAKK